MMLFPFQKQISEQTLFNTACHLYRISLIKILPFSLLSSAIYFFIQKGKKIFTTMPEHYFTNISITLLILYIPIWSIAFKMLDQIGKAKPIFFHDLVDSCARSFINLMNGLLSILLFPALILAFCMVTYILLLKFKVHFAIILLLKLFTPFFVLMGIIQPLFMPLYIICENKDTIEALESSKALTKANYFITLLYAVYALSLIILCAKLPTLFQYYFNLQEGNMLLITGSSAMLLALLGPWSFAFFLSYKYYLEKKTENHLMRLSAKRL